MKCSIKWNYTFSGSILDKTYFRLNFYQGAVMNEMLERLRQKGIALTPQRMAIAEYLSNSTNHPTADEIHKVIRRKYPTMSLATVYSTLELLKELGEIQELSIRKRGKACFDPNPDIHHHLLCRKCGKILGIAFDYPRSCPILEKETINGCKIEEVQAYLYGICSECMGQKGGGED
jgi:Fur family peroxide stress response transcriptional regulator